MKGQLEELENISRELFIKCNSSYIIRDMSINVLGILGFKKEDLIGKSLYELISNKEEIDSITLSSGEGKIELVILNSDNKYLIMDTNYMLINMEGESVIILSMIDITELKNACRERDSLKSLIENSKDVLYYYEIKPEIKFRYVSPSLDKVLGEGLVDISYKNPNICFERIHPDDFKLLENKTSGNGEYDKPILQRWRNGEGEYIWFEEYTTPIVENGQVVAIQGVIRNINEKIKIYNDLEYRITHDSLTDVHSRDFFEKSLYRYENEIDISAGIIICDLDELKHINDTLGHSTGDVLIKEAASILNKFSSENVIVSRIGGDEFAILVLNANEGILKSIVSNIEIEVTKFNQQRKDWLISISKGYDFCESSVGNMKQILEKADNEMYIEKSRKKFIKN